MGCRLNRVEIDSIARELLDAGCELSDEASADVVVVNTCAVTGEAEAKTRKAVRHAASLPHAPLVVATGCVASLFADELTSLMPNVEVEADKSRVASHVLDKLGWVAKSGRSSKQTTPTPTGRMRCGIKIQDGCDNRCTYCIVWKARGAARSVDPTRIIETIRKATGFGSREIVLSGINLGSYSWETERGHTMRLPDLIKEILDTTDVGRLRLSSIEPPDITSELISVMASSSDRVAPFLHACLQSGCDKTLSRMGRVYTSEDYRRVVARAREAIDGLALGCDVIVGFPGETQADFEESLAFCREMRFARMHVFRYSRRPGTPAAAMDNQISAEDQAQRSERMRALAKTMRLAAARSRIGHEELALVQAKGKGVTGGLFTIALDQTLPVDTLVRVKVHDVFSSAVLDGRGSCAGSVVSVGGQDVLH
jgi:threonylcarbamoyladenosine tRNA methylthiotransferase MtaB